MSEADAADPDPDPDPMSIEEAKSQSAKTNTGLDPDPSMWLFVSQNNCVLSLFFTDPRDVLKRRFRFLYLFAIIFPNLVLVEAAMSFTGTLSRAKFGKFTGHAAVQCAAHGYADVPWQGPMVPSDTGEMVPCQGWLYIMLLKTAVALALIVPVSIVLRRVLLTWRDHAYSRRVRLLCGAAFWISLLGFMAGWFFLSFLAIAGGPAGKVTGGPARSGLAPTAAGAAVYAYEVLPAFGSSFILKAILEVPRHMLVYKLDFLKGRTKFIQQMQRRRRYDCDDANEEVPIPM